MLKKILAHFKGLFSCKHVCVCVRNHTSSKVLVEQVKSQDSVVGVDVVKANGSHISRFLVPHTDR